MSLVRASKSKDSIMVYIKNNRFYNKLDEKRNFSTLSLSRHCIKKKSPATLMCGALSHAEQCIDIWKHIADGEFAINVNGAIKDISYLDFRDAVSMNDVANEIDGAARIFGLRCFFNGKSFIIETIATGKEQKIGFLTATGLGIDISGMLHGTKELALSLTHGAGS